jgi:hypothetical protein
VGVNNHDFEAVQFGGQRRRRARAPELLSDLGKRVQHMVSIVEASYDEREINLALVPFQCDERVVDFIYCFGP